MATETQASTSSTCICSTDTAQPCMYPHISTDFVNPRAWINCLMIRVEHKRPRELTENERGAIHFGGVSSIVGFAQGIASRCEDQADVFALAEIVSRFNGSTAAAMTANMMHMFRSSLLVDLFASALTAIETGGNAS